jgi:hypothetical protein
MNTNRALALAAILTATPALAHDVLDIARSSTGQLRVHHHIPMPMMLPESFIVGFDGWANVEPGFQTLAEDDPGHGLFTLSPSCHLEFELLSVDPGLIVWNDTGTAAMAVGERFELGIPFFHVHAIWHLPTTTGPGVYSATVRIHDTTGQHASSAPLTLSFIRTCPADLNADGLIDFADYLEFLTRFDGEDASVDFNQDGFVDFADYLEFLNHYDLEC